VSYFYFRSKTGVYLLLLSDVTAPEAV